MLDPAGDSVSSTRQPFLLIGPAGGGKTAACIRKVATCQQTSPLARVWVVVASWEQHQSFRRRLLQDSGVDRAASFGVELMPFSGLCRRIVDLIDVPPRRVSRTARIYLLRQALADASAQAPLEHYSSIALKRGFAEAALELIDELQEGGVTADAFTTAAVSAGERDLGRIYSCYLAILRSKGLTDESSLGRLAAEALDRNPALGTRIDLLVVDGFDHLKTPQTSLLGRLAKRAREAIFTLTYSSERTDDAIRRPSAARAATYDFLVDSLGCAVQIIERPRPAVRATPFLHMEAGLFSLGTRGRVPAGDAVAVIEAPDPLREAREVGRRVKRLLLDGVLEEEVSVLARSLSNYAPLCREVFQEFGIPVSIQGGSPVADNPAVAALLALLTLAEDRFPRARTIELMRSPYLGNAGFSPEQVNILDRLSRERVVVRGRDQWLDAFVQRGRGDGSPEKTGAPNSNPAGHTYVEDEGIPPSALDELPDEQTKALKDGLERFFNQVTPPAQGSVRDLIRWVEGLVGSDPEERQRRRGEDEPMPEETDSFDVILRARGGPPETGAGDILALCSFKTVLESILAGSELVNPARQLSWSEFLQDLLAGVRQETFDSDPGRAGRVLVAKAQDRRGVPSDHVFLLGMSEGSFPHRPPQDRLLSRAEREGLAGRGVALDTIGPPDEMWLFYEVVSLARKSLTLSRPYLDDTGNFWPASPYLREVQRLLSDMEPIRTSLSYLPPPGGAASLGELSLQAAEGCSQRQGIAEWLGGRQETARAWAASCRGRAVERVRETTAEMGVYHGVLAEPLILSKVAHRLGPSRVWSVSQFDEYAKCPFAFFANRLLKLELSEEPEEGFVALHLGTINHRILELTYRQITDSKIALNVEELPRIRQIFDEVAEHVLASAPSSMGFRPTAWWRHERVDIARRLWRLIEMDASQDELVELLRQEAAFGFRDSAGPALVLEGPAGRLRVRGKIDRIDRVAGGYRVIDYKSGSTKILTEDQARGRNTQMQIYLLAVKDLLPRWGLPDGPVEGFFWHIRDTAKSGRLTLGDARVESARGIIHRNVTQGRLGRFPIEPSKLNGAKCGNHCDFGNLCRMGGG